MIRLSPDDPDGGPDVRLGSNSRSIFFFLLFSIFSSMLGLGPWILHGHLGCTCVYARSMHEVVAMSHMRKVTVRRGVNSPCVQWRMFEVSSYVLLGLGE